MAAAEISCATNCTSRPMSTNSAPFSRKTPNGQAASACRREAAVVTRGDTQATMSPATTTASTPDAWTSSASRNAENGTSSRVTLMTMVEEMRRSSSVARAATTIPAAIPPTYDTSTSQVTESGVTWPPRARDTAMA